MSTSLRTYQVEFRTDAAYATITLAAESLQAVLTAALAYRYDRNQTLNFMPYEFGGHEINEIVIADHDGVELISRYSPEFILRRLAPAMLHTLQRALIALNTAPRFRVHDLACDSDAIADECRRVIAEATGKADARTHPP